MLLLLHFLSVCRAMCCVVWEGREERWLATLSHTLARHAAASGLCLSGLQRRSPCLCCMAEHLMMIRTSQTSSELSCMRCWALRESMKRWQRGAAQKDAMLMAREIESSSSWRLWLDSLTTNTFSQSSHAASSSLSKQKLLDTRTPVSAANVPPLGGAGAESLTLQVELIRSSGFSGKVDGRGATDALL